MTNASSQNRQPDFDRPQSKSDAVNSTTKVERHSRTGAAKTTTPETATPRPGPTPAQVQTKQRADAERAVTTPAAPGTTVVPTTAAPAPATSDEALERNLDRCAGPAGRMIAFNGQTGIHRAIDDGTEVDLPARFTAYPGATRLGFIKFNGADGPPDVRMTGIAEDVPPVTKESLPDREPSAWPISDFTGQPEDPWKFQYIFPIVSDEAGNELFLYVARGVVATKSVESLLGKWKWHPKRRLGLLPVVEISNGTYYSKKFKSDRPKPILTIVDWVDEDGVALTAKAIAAAKHAEYNDEIGF